MGEYNHSTHSPRLKKHTYHFFFYKSIVLNKRDSLWRRFIYLKRSHKHDQLLNVLLRHFYAFRKILKDNL